MLGKSVIRRVRGWIPLSRRARLIARHLPPARWYGTAVTLTRLQWGVCRLLWWRPDILLRHAVFLDLFLLELTQYGPFPIRSRIEGAEHLPQPGSRTKGYLYCTAHVPLFSAQVRVLREIDAAPPLVMALSGAIGTDGCYPIPGLRERVPAVPPGAKTMVRIRREIQSGRTFGSLTDEYAGGPLKPQLFRLAGRLEAPLLFIFSELDRDGAIKLSVVPPPYPLCDTEEKLQANLLAFNTERQRRLAPFHGSKPAAQPRRK